MRRFVHRVIIFHLEIKMNLIKLSSSVMYVHSVRKWRYIYLNDVCVPLSEWEHFQKGDRKNKESSIGHTVNIA
jgi:hypothetical protein